MRSVWQDGPIPVEFHGCSLRFENIGKIGYFGNLVSAISPIIVLLVTLAFVKVSYYSASAEVIVSQTPIVVPPKYYLIVTQKNDGSELYSNLPDFQKGVIRQMYGGGSMSSGVMYDQVLKLTFDFPNDGFIMATMYVPIQIRFPGISRQSSFGMLQFSAKPGNSMYGRLVLTQKSTLNAAATSYTDMYDFLNDRVRINATEMLTAALLTKAVDDQPFNVGYTLSTIDETSSVTTQVNVQLRIPGVFVKTGASFWNMLKMTYVQVFYWFCLIYLLWRAVINGAFKYGIISSIVRYPLKNSKEHAD